MSEQRPDRSGKKPSRPAPPTPNGMRFGRGLFGWVLFIALMVMLFLLINSKNATSQTISISEFESRLQSDKVSKVVVTGDDISGEFRSAEDIGPTPKVKSFRVPYPTGTFTNSSTRLGWIMENRKQADVAAEN